MGLGMHMGVLPLGGAGQGWWTRGPGPPPRPSPGSVRLLQAKNMDYYKREVSGARRWERGWERGRRALTCPVGRPQIEYCRKAMARTRVKSSICLEG